MPHKYDTAFKLTLQHVDVAMQELLGSTVKSWKNIEFPQVRAPPRADLLGETKAGELVHLELQSGNAKDMAIRMLEYGLAVLRQCRLSELLTIRATESGKTCHERWQDPTVSSYRVCITHFRIVRGRLSGRFRLAI